MAPERAISRLRGKVGLARLGVSIALLLIGCADSAPDAAGSSPTDGGSPTTTDGATHDTQGGVLKVRFSEEAVVREDSADWDGTPIEIEVDGVAVSVNGGVSVIASESTKRVKATARFVALAAESAKADADASLEEAKATFAISRRGSALVIACRHGGSHGSSDDRDSGCEQLTVEVPAGSRSSPLQLKLSTKTGLDELDLTAATLRAVDVTHDGDISAKLAATKGASVTMTAARAHDLTVTLPDGWAADSVQLSADKLESAVTSGQPHGTPGVGLALLKLTSEPLAGVAGTITLQ